MLQGLEEKNEKQKKSEKQEGWDSSSRFSDGCRKGSGVHNRVLQAGSSASVEEKRSS